MASPTLIKEAFMFLGRVQLFKLIDCWNSPGVSIGLIEVGYEMAGGGSSLELRKW